VPDEGVLLGAGRSGIVYRVRDREGRTVARKTFESGPVTRLVQYLFLGAPNPYAWSEDAVQCALFRRRILAPLVRHWFGDGLRVAAAWSQDWNEQRLAYQLHTEFIGGVAPTLHHPMNRRGAREVNELLAVMGSLQERLIESGFVGLAWQAGLGNPVALANFLRLPDESGARRWAWIDLESGVPALFPLSLRAFAFYIRQSWQRGRALFDDVDTGVLSEYLGAREAELAASLGPESMEELRGDVEALRLHQNAWKATSRTESSVTYQLKKRRITEDEARFYGQHPFRWLVHEAGRMAREGVHEVGRRTVAGWRLLRGLPYRKLFRAVVGFLCSQEFRRKLAQQLVARRIDSWQRRKQLLNEEAAKLRAHLESEESCAYLTDFGVHVAIKPFVKGVEFLVFPTLFSLGVIDEGTLYLAILAGGCLARTLYTAGRLVQSFLTRRELPWVALAVGAIPIVGNLAYPLQIVYSSTEEDDILAQFILYDGCSAIGRKIPMYGGRDTLTEHVFNHLPDRIVRGRRGPRDDSAGFPA